MLVKYFVCSLLTLSIIAFAGAAKETLVLLNNLVIKETHSILFNTLKGRYFVFPVYLVVDIIGCRVSSNDENLHRSCLGV